MYTAELDSIIELYKNEGTAIQEMIISKEHPLFEHYPGKKDTRDWMFPEVTGYYPSFFSYWKKCEKWLKKIVN